MWGRCTRTVARSTDADTVGVFANPCLWPLTLAAIAALLLLLMPAVRAQDAPAVAAPKSPPAPAYPTLLAALKATAWNAADRGPLLAIAPNSVMAPKSDTETPPAAADDPSQQPLLPPREGFNPSLVARHFGCRLVSVGSLTVMAPLEMTVFNRDLKPANPFLGLDTENKMRRLESTLTPAQWTQLGSANGLGRGDLSEPQQLLFEALLPETISFVKAKRPAPDAEEGDLVMPTPTTLNATERADVRLRLDRIADFSLVSKDKTQMVGSYAFSSYAVGDEGLFLVDPPASAMLPENDLVFGQSLLVHRANALKPSDLDLKTAYLDAPIPVEGLRTVGELVQAVRKATGHEIYVDRRLAPYSLYFSPHAQAARAGDLLTALCWGLTATFRQVGTPASGSDAGSVFILTHDREGVFVRRNLIWQWQKLGENALYDTETALRDHDPSLHASEIAHFAAGDLQALTPEAESKLETSDASGLNYPTLPAANLSSVQQKQLRDSLNSFVEANADSLEKPELPRTDRIAVALRQGLTLVVPGVGEIRRVGDWVDLKYQQGTFAREEQAEAETVKKRYQSAPVAIKNATICLAPRTRAEVEVAMDALKPRGVTTFWLRVPETPEGRALLADCVAAGKVRGIPVGAVVSLMQSPPNAASGKLPDALEALNILGETGAASSARIAGTSVLLDGTDPAHEYPFPDAADWLAPDAAGTLPLLQARLHAIAAVPGIAALVCDEAAAPGYRTHSDDVRLNWFGDDFGYSVANRLAMIRQYGCDPIDVGEPGAMITRRGEDVEGETYIHFFDDEPSDDPASLLAEPTQKTEGAYSPTPPVLFWRAFRADQQRHLLASLRTDLLATYPALPVFFSLDSLHGSYERWDRPTAPLWIEALERLPIPQATLPRLYRSVVFRPDMLDYLKRSFYGKATDSVTAPQLLAASIAGRSQQGVSAVASRPLILDLSAMPIDAALPLLKAALLPPKGTSAP